MTRKVHGKIHSGSADELIHFEENAWSRERACKLKRSDNALRVAEKTIMGFNLLSRILLSHSLQQSFRD